MTDRRLALGEQLAKRAYVDFVVLHQIMNDPQPRLIGQELYDHPIAGIHGHHAAAAGDPARARAATARGRRGAEERVRLRAFRERQSADATRAAPIKTAVRSSDSVTPAYSL